MKTSENIQPRKSIAGMRVAALQLTDTTQAVAWIRPSDKKRMDNIRMRLLKRWKRSLQK